MKRVYGIWQGDCWHYGGSKIFATGSYDVACAQLMCCRHMGMDPAGEVKIIGPGGKPLPADTIFIEGPLFAEYLPPREQPCDPPLYLSARQTADAEFHVPETTVVV